MRKYEPIVGTGSTNIYTSHICVSLNRDMVTSTCQQRLYMNGTFIGKNGLGLREI